jgi:hypothetical protein
MPNEVKIGADIDCVTMFRSQLPKQAIIHLRLPRSQYRTERLSDKVLPERLIIPHDLRVFRLQHLKVAQAVAMIDLVRQTRTCFQSGSFELELGLDVDGHSVAHSSGYGGQIRDGEAVLARLHVSRG